LYQRYLGDVCRRHDEAYFRKPWNSVASALDYSENKEHAVAPVLIAKYRIERARARAIVKRIGRLNFIQIARSARSLD